MRFRMSPSRLTAALIGGLAVLAAAQPATAARAERELASDGDLRPGSNLGKGQVKAADYVLVPDLVSSNSDSSGNNIGAALGGLVGNRNVGALIGGLNIKRKTADVVLTVTD